MAEEQKAVEFKLLIAEIDALLDQAHADLDAEFSDALHTRDIEIGAPDGNGYAGWLRACADRIEELEMLAAIHITTPAQRRQE